MGQSNVNQPLGLLLSQFKTARHPSIERHLEVEKVAILDSLDAARIIAAPKAVPAGTMAGAPHRRGQAGLAGLGYFLRQGVSELTKTRINPPKVMISRKTQKHLLLLIWG